MLTEFGVGRLASYHYIIHADAPSLALVMSRKTFAGLPAQLQDIIRRYSGEWAVARSNEFFEGINAKSMEQLKSDPKRKVIFPSDSDRAKIEAAFKSVTEDWVAKDPRNRELLAWCAPKSPNCARADKADAFDRDDVHRAQHRRSGGRALHPGRRHLGWP